MADNFTMRRRMAASSSWAVLGLAIAFGSGQAQAQTPQTSNSGATILTDAEVAQEIVVTGSRASQQSAINRKKNAITATDSIVADDIGSFPDRNVNEALSRVPGVALSRNDFGEGDGIAVRGNGPDLTRVELDGIGIQSTNAGGTDRGADLRELPAELIKSVDVVKGSTADMTEGSLGGSVLIKTRTGLDFKQPYFSVRAGAQMNTLGKKWTPDFNAVAARRFFDDRLGVIVTGTYTNIQLNGHNAENTTSNNRNYDRLYDFDNSPEKTFAFNPDTLSADAESDIIFPNSAETPRSLVTKAAGVQSKAECFTVFPNNPLGTAAQRSQRILEQQTCLRQWNDYTPSLIRQFQNSQDDQRYTIDARVDYQLTDDFIVYAKFNQSNRKTDDQNRSRNTANGLGANAGVPIQGNIAGTFLISPAPPAGAYPLTRSVNPNGPSGYYLYDPQFGINNSGNNAVLGNVLNVVPGSFTVDSAHNVTKLTTTNNITNIDQLSNVTDVKTQYALVGGDYVGERLEINFLAGRTTAKSSREDLRTSRNSFYGDATLSIQPNGLWGLELPDDYDISDPSQFVQLQAPVCITANPAVVPALPNTRPNCRGRNPVLATDNNPADTNAYSVGQLPLTTPGFSVSYTPSLGENSETLAKADFAYRTDGLLPLLARVKTGLMYRENRNKRWGGGGFIAESAVGTFGTPGYVPPVVVPRALVRGTLQACENTAGSLAPGGLPCAYGFTQSTNLGNAREGLDVLTPDQLRDLFARTLEPATSQYFDGLPNRGNLPGNWDGIRTRELFQELGNYQFMNFDCVKVCTANNGQEYAQPLSDTRETIKNAYFMADFEQDLPFGTRFTGNAGVRAVHTTVSGTGAIQLNAIRVTPAFNPLDPTAAGGTTTQNFRQNVSIKKTTMDWLPTFNANLWGFNDKLVGRYYGGKTIARPPISNLVPSGLCTIDERGLINVGQEEDQGCSGRVGNPGLSPYTAWNHNVSLEWYPNRDTSISVAYNYLDVSIGAPIADTAQGNLFAGSDLIDPVTGRPASELVFTYPTFTNGPGYKRQGWEVGVKTAFTFLPWFLQYTGADFNISTLKSKVEQGVRDPVTGETQLPPNESRYYTNLSLWYDDGKLNLRVAYQDRTSRFLCITPCGGNTGDINYPGEGYTNVRLVGPGYNPGVPRFQDGSTFIDAKASYNISKNFQVYVEGRNLRREAQTVSLGEYQPFEDGSKKILKLSYGGLRVLTGARIQFGN